MRSLLVGAGLLSILSAGTPCVKLPEVRATLLSGATMNLPGDVRGKPTVIVIGFSRGSQDQVAAWGRRLTPDYHGASDVAFFEAAELESVPGILRGWVTKKIRETVPERAHGHFFTVSDREAEWKSAAHYVAKDDGAKDDAYVMLVDPAGQVRYTVHGATSDAAYAELKRRLENLRRP